MKRITCILLLLAALASACVAGWYTGVRYAMTHSEIWLAEWVEPENGEGDWLVNIDLDGQRWQHSLWVY